MSSISFLNFTINSIDCDVSCHKKCEKLAANLCGVNQKLIVEVLSSVNLSMNNSNTDIASAGINSHTNSFSHQKNSLIHGVNDMGMHIHKYIYIFFKHVTVHYK